MVNRTGAEASRFPALRGLPSEGLQSLTHCLQNRTMVATTDVVNVRTDPQKTWLRNCSDGEDHVKRAIGKANRKDGEGGGLSSRYSSAQRRDLDRKRKRPRCARSDEAQAAAPPAGHPYRTQ